MVELETVVTQLYEDESLTDELVDADAAVLLKWGEAQLPQLIAQAPTETAFEESFGSLRRYIRQVNRFVGKRDAAAPQDLQEMLARLAEAALALRPELPPEAVAALGPAHHGQPNQDVIRALLHLITPQPPQTEPPTPAEGEF